MQPLLLFTLALSFALTVDAQGNGASITPQGGTVKIKIAAGGKTLTAAMADNAAARDFVSLLPLTLTAVWTFLMPAVQ